MARFAGVAMVAVVTSCAFGVSPAEHEISLADGFWQEHFAKDAGNLFSFTYNGKPSSETLKSSEKRVSDKRAKGKLVRTIAYFDKATGLQTKCVATRFEGTSALEWVVYLENRGTQPTPIVENVLALDWTYGIGNAKAAMVHRALGESNSGDSFRPIDTALGVGDSLVLHPNGGRSSDPHMPFYNLETEPGSGVAVGIGWSGQWQAAFARTEKGKVSLKIGQQLTHFKLMPGEKVRTPRMLMVFWKGTESIRGNNLFRQTMLNHYVAKKNGKPVVAPICATVNWTEPDGTYEKPHVETMPIYKKLGIEVFWSDMDPNHWYPLGFAEGTGNYQVDKAKYPNGLEPVGAATQKAGLPYLLWFEPERVAPNTDVDKQHPEFLLKPNEGHRLFNLGDPKAWTWMTENLDGFVNRLHLSWIRQDFNIDPLGFWRWADAPDRQGITENHYITGLYAMWDELRKRHPGLTIDLCASGGRRIDIETLQRGVPLWHSDLQCSGPHDAADQLQNAGLWMWMPYHGSGNFGLEPSYSFRSSMTTGNILCNGAESGKLSTAEPTKAEAVKASIKLYKKLRPSMAGDFYPLFPHSESEEAWFGYQFHRADLDSGVIILFRRSKCPEDIMDVNLKALGIDKTYIFTDYDSGESKELRFENRLVYSSCIKETPGSMVIFYRAKAN